MTAPGDVIEAPEPPAGDGEPEAATEQDAPVSYGTCCGVRDARGRPYTPHFFVWHDKFGSIDLGHTLTTLPISELASAGLLSSMAREAGSPMLCGQKTGRWLAWDGTVYAPQRSTWAADMAQWFAGAYVDALRDIETASNRAASDDVPLTEAEEEVFQDQLKKERAVWVRHFSHRDRLWSEAGQAALIRQAARTCAVDEDILDAATGVIVVGNGRITVAQILRDGRVELAPHDSRVPVTKRTGRAVWYDPAATCPAFDHFLETSVADPEQRWWLLWRTASALFGQMPRKGFLNLIGERDSGKSTYLRLMAALAGGYGRTVPIKTFLAKRDGGTGFLEADLRGARFVYAQEPPPGARFDEGSVKTLTGRDPQRTAGKYEKPIDWFPQFTAFLGSNGPIRLTTSDDALMNRQEVIRFARGYDVPDHYLDDRLMAELPGILNRLLATLVQVAYWGLPPDVPASMAAERERLATETDSALSFVQEWIEQGQLAEVDTEEVAISRCVQVTELFRHYQAWCADTEGVQDRAGRKAFSATVARRYPAKKSNGYRFAGLVAVNVPGIWPNPG